MDLSRAICAHNPIIRTANGRWWVKSTASPDGPDSPLSERYLYSPTTRSTPDAPQIHPLNPCRRVPRESARVPPQDRDRHRRRGKHGLLPRWPQARPADHENPSHDADASPRILPRAGCRIPAALVVVRCRRRPNGATVRPLSSSPLCV